MDMKQFKTIDLFVSIALILGFAIYWLVKPGSFFVAYFVVGSWQVISMLVHAFNKCFTYKKGKRYMYHWISFISIATVPLGSFRVLIFLAPVMAVYYSWLCYREVFIKMRRPLALLK